MEGPGAFVCADFAEAIHNNAEAVGIRAGWVSLTFEGTSEGHALNAFETADRGLVYIDCTNSGSPAGQGKGPPSWDAIAYIEKGKKYGVLTVGRVIVVKDYYYPLEYSFYADCEKAWQEYAIKLKAYNEGVDKFNRETGGRVFYFGSPEAGRFSTWKDELASQEKELENLKEKTGDRWLESEYSSYLVKSVIIHW